MIDASPSEDDNVDDSTISSATPVDTAGRERDAIERPSPILAKSSSCIGLNAVKRMSIVEEAPVQEHIRRNFSDQALPTCRERDVRSDYSSKNSSIFRTKSRLNKTNPPIDLPHQRNARQRQMPELTELPPAIVHGKKEEDFTRTKSMTSSISSFARRKSWVLPSRSPSPGKPALRSSHNERTTVLDKSSPLGQEVPTLHHQRPPLQRQPTSGGKSKRPMSALLSRSVSAVVGSVPPLPKASSIDSLPALTNDGSSSTDSGSASGDSSIRQLHNNATRSESPRRRDELFPAFRSLELEHQKYQSKPFTARAFAIKTVLLPFFKAHPNQIEHYALRPEDLDRRIQVLNKWWLALLDMLAPSNWQALSVNDRPAILDSLSYIMERREWRIPMSSLTSRQQKSRPLIKPSLSSPSLDTGASDFLAESIIHSVRNIFIQNLISQMAFAVERMSMKTAAASVVAFCGKAAAYAFVYCPGVADILVRLWNLPSRTLKRVLDENPEAKSQNLVDIGAEVCRYFPQHLRALAFKSLPCHMKYLRGRHPMPLTSLYIPWYGPWTRRWRAQDSDLFYTFVRHHHILLSTMLPKESSTIQRLCAPTALLVYAQTLSVMDNLFHKPPQIENPLPSVTFDEVLAADSVAAPAPVRAAHIQRSMAENRLIMLLREMLADSLPVHPVVKSTFAEPFGRILTASTKRISLYDQQACYVLCDFVEETTTVLSRYYRDVDDPASFLDWQFWFEVCRRMGEANVSMSEVRLSALVYALWGFLTRNSERKMDICRNWLLEEKYFMRQFNHWCPMVRAYYMRLLCWRVARYDGLAAQSDLDIFRLLKTRLDQSWDQYIQMREKAIAQNTALPSTIPANPAPSRRLLILRNDSVNTPAAMLSSFDAMPAATTSAPTAYEKYTSLDALRQAAALLGGGTEPQSSGPNRKRWTLRSINPFVTTPSDLRHEISNNHSNGRPGGKVNKDDSDSDGTSTPPTPGGTRSQPVTPPNGQKFQNSFKFSLELLDQNQYPQRERILEPPRLPFMAQEYLNQHPFETAPSSPIKASFKVTPAQPNWAVYTGRALAEWACLISENKNFYDRRLNEGVPEPKWVETPTLGVESLRRPMG